MMKTIKKLGFATGIVLALGAGVLPAAQAQQAPNVNNGAALALPDGIENVVSIDAHNVIIAEGRDRDNPEKRSYALIVPRHVYSGGIARIFGGEVIPTEQFLVPGYGRGNTGGPQRGGVLSINSNNPFGGNFNGGNVNNSGINQNFGYNQNFGNTTFNTPQF